MPHQRVATTSTIHKHLQQLQRKAIASVAPLPEMLVKFFDTKAKKGIDKLPHMVYTSTCMSNLAAANQIRCKHCEKTFPTQQALQKHMTHVSAGKAGGYRKHRAPRRFTVVETQPQRNGDQPITALGRLAELEAREEQLLVALKEIGELKKSAQDDVKREYEEKAKSIAEYSAKVTAIRRAEIAVREEMEAHKHTPEQS